MNKPRGLGGVSSRVHGVSFCVVSRFAYAVLGNHGILLVLLMRVCSILFLYFVFFVLVLPVFLLFRLVSFCFDAVFWFLGNHGIIASKRCDHLLVKDNESYDNDGSGIMLHKSCDDSIVSGTYCFRLPGTW